MGSKAAAPAQAAGFVVALVCVALELLPSETVDTIASTAIAYVLDASRGSILAVDTRSGDRLIPTK